MARVLGRGSQSRCRDSTTLSAGRLLALDRDLPKIESPILRVFAIIESDSEFLMQRTAQLPTGRGSLAGDSVDRLIAFVSAVLGIVRIEAF